MEPNILPCNYFLPFQQSFYMYLHYYDFKLRRKPYKASTLCFASKGLYMHSHLTYIYMSFECDFRVLCGSGLLSSKPWSYLRSIAIMESPCLMARIHTRYAYVLIRAGSSISGSRVPENRSGTFLSSGTRKNALWLWEVIVNTEIY